MRRKDRCGERGHQRGQKAKAGSLKQAKEGQTLKAPRRMAQTFSRKEVRDGAGPGLPGDLSAEGPGD